MTKDLNESSKKQQETSKGGLRGWWSKRSTKGKATIGICCIGLILMVIIGGTLSPDANTANTTNMSSDNNSDTHSNTQTTSTSNTSPNPNFSVGTSKFYLSGGFNQGTTTSGSEASRLTLDNSDIHAIVTEYSDKDLYTIESKNAGSYKTIDGVTVTKIPDTLSVFFEKNGKYYSIALYQTDGQTPASETSETQQYIQDIVGSMQNA